MAHLYPVAITRNFPMAIVDTTSVVVLGFIAGQRFPMALSDTTLVQALGLEVNRHFPLAITDTTSVLALGFHFIGHYPLQVTDSTVVALGFEVDRAGFPLHITDATSVVRLGLEIFVPPPELGVHTVVSTSVWLGFEVAAPIVPVIPFNPVPPYAGANQPSAILVSGVAPPMEEGCWVMPPYEQLYPQETVILTADIVPPPLSRTDLWSAMQTWPL